MSDYEGNFFHANISGVTFANSDGTSRQELVRHCRIGDVVVLIRDKNNEHDANAVMVVHRLGQLGWLRSAALEEFAEFLDNGGQASARICELTGGTPDKPTRGVNLEITECRQEQRSAPVSTELVIPAPVAMPVALTVPQSTDDEARVRGELAKVQVRRQQLIQQLADQKKRSSHVKRQALWLGAKLHYLRAADVCRLMAQRLIGWRLGMVLIYAALVLILVFFCEIVLGYGLQTLGVGVVFIGFLAALHYFPGDAVLAQNAGQIGEQHGRLVAERTQHQRFLEQLTLQERELALQEAQLENQALRANKQWQLQQRRLALLQMPWKSYRSVEFEQFLKEVFEALGCTAETTKVTGDQGADLVVAFGKYRIAVQAKGYVASVGNAAVQQAYSAMTFYTCHRCMVITNSVFTSSAVQLAQATGCILIDENLLPDMVLGRIDFCGFATVGAAG